MDVTITESVALAETILGNPTYCVDPVDGNDSNAGTAASPWLTMSKANLTAVDGSTVYLRSGNYGEVNITNTGLGRTSWADAVVYRPDPGHSPVFDQLLIQNTADRYMMFRNIV